PRPPLPSWRAPPLLLRAPPRRPCVWLPSPHRHRRRQVRLLLRKPLQPAAAPELPLSPHALPRQLCASLPSPHRHPPPYRTPRLALALLPAAAGLQSPPLSLPYRLRPPSRSLAPPVQPRANPTAPT